MQVKKILPVIGILILAYLIYSIGAANILQSLYMANLRYIVYSMLFFLIVIPVQVYKWRYLVVRQGIQVSFLFLLYAHIMGWFYGLITPGKIGSLIRISYLKDRTGKSLSTCAPNVLLDRILDLFAIFTLALMSIFTLSGANEFMFLFGVMFIILVVGFFGITRPGPGKFIFGIIFRFGFPDSIKQKIGRSFDEFFSSLPNTRILIIPFILSLLSWVLLYSQGFIVAKAFGISIPYLTFITILPIASIIGLIPITISGLGTREATTVLLFAPFGIAAATVVSFSLTAYIITLIIPLVLGFAIRLTLK